MKNIKNKRFSKIFKPKKQVPIEDLKIGKCLNCGYEFKGHYCPNCGQEVNEFNRPFGFFMYDFMGNFFAFDTRFFKTFKYLLFYPGFLTKEFFLGRRKRYSPPFRIFVFLSFILFLLLSFLTDRGLEAELNTEIENSSIETQKGIVELNDGIEQFKEEMKEVPMDSSMTELLFTEKDSNKINVNLGNVFIGKGSLRQRLEQLADILERELEKETDIEKRRKLQEYIIMCRTPEVAISQLLQYLSWASFLLLPLFALILKLFYVRRKQLYIKHLLFSIHIHSFVFALLISVIIPWLVFNAVPGIFNLFISIVIPLYIIIAMRNFYRQSWLKSIIKFLIIAMIYNFTLSTVVLLAFLKSLHVF